MKALKKPLAPLSKPSSNSSNNNLMGFGMGGGAAAAAAETASAPNGEIDLLGVSNSNEPRNEGPTDLLSAMSSGPSAQPDFFS